MESQLKHLADKLVPRQTALEFTQSDHWQHLSRHEQQACCQAIAELLRQVVTSTQEKETQEKEDD